MKRSILKQIKTKREEVLSGAGVGGDCAVLSFSGEEVCVMSMDPVTVGRGRSARCAVMETVNDLAAGGAEPVGIMVTALLPETITEDGMKQMMAETEQTCRELNIQIIGGHTEISEAVNKPVLIVSGVGKAKKGKAAVTGGAKPGQDIVVTKWIGLEGTAIIAKEKETELRQKYPAHLIEEAKELERFLSILPEAAAAVRNGTLVMHDVSEGGIFGALWELAESSGTGLEIDLKKLPVKQETIEVCEFFDLNPYELISGGALLLAADNGFDLVKALEKEHIPAAVVGKVTDNNDRVVINEEERRFLEPPKSDEIHKIKFE